MTRAWFDRTWGRRIVAATLVAFIVACLALTVFLWSATHRSAPPAAERYVGARGSGSELARLWRAPSFALVDQRRRPVTEGDLRGQPFIADFMFTECANACPILTSKLVMLQRKLAGVGLRFVSFSVDPAHDTPEVLAAYAARWNAPETRWMLLATGTDTLRELASGYRVAAQATGEAANPVLHSTMFFLVDGGGDIRGVYSSTDDDALDQLESDARGLASGAAGPGAAPARSLYSALGCAGCHENPKLAPPLVNLLGAERMLKSGAKVKVDEAYVRRSILDPEADVVAGYAPLMPSYARALGESEIAALVAEIESRVDRDAAAPDPKVLVVVDPVCKMKVRAVPETLHVTRDGEEVYFCSETCRDAYEKDPKRYPLHAVAGAAPP